jgi:hypothetical protein
LSIGIWSNHISFYILDLQLKNPLDILKCSQNSMMQGISQQSEETANGTEENI